MRNYILTVALVLASFALGWCANGYVIYRGIVGSMESAVQIPVGKGK